MPGRRPHVVLLVVLLVAQGLALALTTTSSAAPRKAGDPRIKSLSVGAGPTAGGTRVTIKGRHLKGVTKVVFGRSPGSRLQVRDERTLVVTTPPHEAGGVSVRLVWAHGRSPIRKGPRFVYVGAAATPGPPVPGSGPAVGSVVPNYGTIKGGQEVTIVGAALDGATAVLFGGTPASFRQVSATTILATTPPHAAGAVGVQVVTPAGTSSGGATQYSYTTCATPGIDRFEPIQLWETGGGDLVLETRRYYQVTTVLFGDVPSPRVRHRDNRELLVTVPPHPVGYVDLVLINDCGPSVFRDGVRFVAPKATITGISPNQAATTGGSVVTVTGTNFSDVEEVTVYDEEPVIDWTVVSRTQMLVTLPPSFEGGNALKIRTASGEAQVPAGGSNGLTYVPPPRVSRVHSPYGEMSGGKEVVLTGRWFQGLGGVTQVTFGGVPGTDLLVVSDTEVRVTAPPHAAGSVLVRATNAVGTSVTNANTWFTYETPQTRVGRVVDVTGPPGAVPESVQVHELECPQTGRCLAIGSYRATAGPLPFVLDHSAGRSTYQPLPLPPDASTSWPSASLLALDCPVEDFCAAVGNYGTEDEWRPLLATWDGTAWSSTTIGPPVESLSQYSTHMACAANRTCVVSSGYDGRALAYRDGAWTTSVWELPPGTDQVWVNDVACATTECTAVGSVWVDEDDPRQLPMAQRWRNGVWTLALPAAPAELTGDLHLAAVACPADGRCVAAGNGYPGNYDIRAFVVTQNGEAWSAELLPRPPDSAVWPGPYADHVDCTAVGRCWVAGRYDWDDGSEWSANRPYVADLVGGAWRAREAPLPDRDPVAGWAGFNAFRCLGPSTCVGTSQYDLAAGRTQGLLTTVRPASISGQQLALPLAGSEDPALVSDALRDLAFDSPTTAVALGYYRKAADDYAEYPMLLVDLPVS